jgi:hypothetical protein
VEDPRGFNSGEGNFLHSVDKVPGIFPAVKAPATLDNCTVTLNIRRNVRNLPAFVPGKSSPQEEKDFPRELNSNSRGLNSNSRGSKRKARFPPEAGMSPTYIKDLCKYKIAAS